MIRDLTTHRVGRWMLTEGAVSRAAVHPYLPTLPLIYPLLNPQCTPGTTLRLISFYRSVLYALGTT
jgi:hypothetical protein